MLLIQGKGWLSLPLIAFAHALLLIPTLIPRCGWCGEVISSLNDTGIQAEKAVWLTIDDGPHPEDTPRLLELLEAYGAQATFFFIGKRARQHPELVQEVLRRGHDVGNHTLTHPQYAFWAYPPAKLAAEIRACQQTLQQAAGDLDFTPRWFRAPAGLKNPFVHSLLEKEGLRLACWNARGLDGVLTDPEKIMARLAPEIQGNAIILLHEARQEITGERLAPKILQQVLEILHQKGLSTVIP